jgi:hypothetical protein
VQGMNITMTTSVDSNDEAREMLRLFGMPFRTDWKTTERGTVEPAEVAVVARVMHC